MTLHVKLQEKYCDFFLHFLYNNCSFKNVKQLKNKLESQGSHCVK